MDPALAKDDQPGPPVKFAATRLDDGVDTATAGTLVADVDGDGKPDLIVWSAAGIKVYRGGAAPAADCGLTGVKDVLSVAAGDYNNDGLADLAVVTKSGAALYLNQKGTFARQDVKLPAGAFTRAVWLDFDHDYDLDLILLGENSALMRNNGAAGFSDESKAFPFVNGRVLDAAAFDLVPDTDGFDLVVTFEDRPGVLYRDRLAGRYQAEDLPQIPPGSRVAAFDFNNDGATDLAVATPAGTRVLLNRSNVAAPQPKFDDAATLAGSTALATLDAENRGITDIAAAGTLFRNQGLGHFADAKAAALAGAVAYAAADFDGDGRTDLAVVNKDGSVNLLVNQTEIRNHWLRGSLLGVKNLKLAYASKVEVKAGARYQKLTYRGVPLQFGLGPYQEIDTVRITWANGMIQNELKQVAGKPAVFKEAPRLSGSCPMIFTWNGRAFQFVTDVLGVAPLGASAGGGQYFPVDHDEYVQIPAGALAAVDGRYEVRITEELREVSYLDQVKLIAVDHPASTEIFTNDNFKPPPFPEFRLFGAERRVYPLAARDHRGADVLPRLLRRDLRYPDAFGRDSNGTAELHTLDLDFGRAAPDNRAVLILNGWVDWADGSTFLAASQQKPGGLVMPYLQVKDAAGAWRTVIEDMGIPAGKPKTMAVDLTGKFLSASREVRIVTSLCVYWDEIFLSEDTAAPSAVLTELAPDTADLRFRGFSRPVIDAERKQPERFLYDQVQPVSQWNPTPGMYTRYGDVRPVISAIDDRLVIMGSGDELRLRFDGRGLPPLRAGWTRDFLLFVDGWAKDADANTAFAKSVEPLPFHGMSAYPYPAPQHYPDDAGHQQYRNQYNTRPALRLLRPLTD